MKELTLRALLILLLTLFLAAFTAGCNTMEGAGEDMEAVGDEIEEATDDAAD